MPYDGFGANVVAASVDTAPARLAVVSPSRSLRALSSLAAHAEPSSGTAQARSPAAEPATVKSWARPVRPRFRAGVHALPPGAPPDRHERAPRGDHHLQAAVCSLGLPACSDFPYLFKAAPAAPRG